VNRLYRNSTSAPARIPVLRTHAVLRARLVRRVAATVLSLLIGGFFHPLGAGPPSGDANGAPLRQLSLEELGAVEVTTVSKKPEKVWRTPAAIYVLTQEDIRRSGATSIPEALRLVPGVEVARIDSSQWAVGIRGFGNGFSKSVLVLIDGRSVYTPLYAGVYWSVQNMLLADVERIEVIRGPGATVWGANAVNGVINIITKNSKDSQGALVSLGGGNVDQGNAGFRYGGSFGKNVNYRMYGMAFARGPESHPDYDNFDPWQLGQGGFRLDWDNQSRDALSFQADLFKGEIGQQQNITSYSPPASINVDGIEDVSGGHILGRWQHKFGEGSDIQVQGYFDRTYRLTPGVGESRNTFDLDFVHHLTLPRQDVTWGVGARWSPSNIIQTVAAVDFLPHHQSDNTYGAFAQDEIAIVQSKLWATLGTKFEHNIYTGWEVMPSARLLWTPSSHQTFWTAVTRAVRTPSRIDEDLQLTGLAATSPIPIFVTVAGNPNFLSETLLGYEAGYRQLVTRRVYVDVALFHNQYDNLTSIGSSLTISVENSPSPTHLLAIVPWGNGIKGTTNGGEIAPDWKATRWLELKGSYSYTSLDLRNKLGNTDIATVLTDEGSSPRHQVVVQSLFNLPMGFELDPTYRYVSALPALSVKAYTTMDVRLGWHLTRNLQLSLVGQNLFQPEHVEFNGDPSALIGIKRSAYAQIIWAR
jgi:iron complex outermembrane recepter protein